MSGGYMTGAGWCVKRGMHRYSTTVLDGGALLERCLDCGEKAPMFTQDELDEFDARDAALDHRHSLEEQRADWEARDHQRDGDVR